MLIFGILVVPSGCIAPASILQNVVFPVPFSPIMTMISESLNSPDSMDSLKLPWSWLWSIMNSSPASPMRNCNDSSRKRRFSVGMLPSRKMLIPSRTDAGSVTTP
ncbi:hypothetical protein EJ07DRAFT_98465 [Lizonia empirigonia]|nr:hypothetical protein EJ07DRAFT_98465 [Lizonia empirigonia]